MTLALAIMMSLVVAIPALTIGSSAIMVGPAPVITFVTIIVLVIFMNPLAILAAATLAIAIALTVLVGVGDLVLGGGLKVLVVDDVWTLLLDGQGRAGLPGRGHSGSICTLVSVLGPVLFSNDSVGSQSTFWQSAGPAPSSPSLWSGCLKGPYWCW